MVIVFNLWLINAALFLTYPFLATTNRESLCAWVDVAHLNFSREVSWLPLLQKGEQGGK